MESINKVTPKEAEELLQEFPELQRFSNHMKMIVELVEDAEKETDLAFMADSFKTVLRLQERLHAEMLTWYLDEHKKQFDGMAENCREWKAIAEKLEAALKKERQEADEMFEKMCFLLLVDPRKTFEDVILKQIERKKKAESADGYENWQWTLGFPLLARLRMAWRLLFG